MLDVIRNRRTHRKFKAKIPYVELLEVLEVAKYTPNHNKRYPYRFEILNENDINKIVKLAQDNDISLPPYFQNLLKEPSKFPTFVLVIMPKNSNFKKFQEDILANGALIQNIHLELESRGYSMCWKTYFINENFPSLYGIGNGELVTGFLEMGVPDDTPLEINYDDINIDIAGIYD